MTDLEKALAYSTDSGLVSQLPYILEVLAKQVVRARYIVGDEARLVHVREAIRHLQKAVAPPVAGA